MRIHVAVLILATALLSLPPAAHAQQVRKHDAKRAQCQKKAMQDKIPPEKTADFLKECMEQKALERAGVKEK